MATQIALTLNENNDEMINVTITTNQPNLNTPLDLTGLTVEAFLKVNAATSDVDASTWKGSTSTSEVTVTDIANGKVSIAIPASAVSLGKGWWRCDVLTGTGKRKTAAYGAVIVTDL